MSRFSNSVNILLKVLIPTENMLGINGHNTVHGNIMIYNLKLKQRTVNLVKKFKNA